MDFSFNMACPERVIHGNRQHFSRQVITSSHHPRIGQLGKGFEKGFDFEDADGGIFEDLPSGRAIASRCADSLSIRGCLGCTLTEATPDHSSLNVIRNRLSLDQLEAIHRVLLAALHAHGLLKGRNLGIDSSLIAAKASLRVQLRACLSVAA